MKILERRLLKGGSLAGTYVIITSSGQYVLSKTENMVIKDGIHN